MYDGNFCEHVDVCRKFGNLCEKGQCLLDSSSKRSFRCQCDDGFYGPYCNITHQGGFVSGFKENYVWCLPLIAFALLLVVVCVFAVVSELKDRIQRKMADPTTSAVRHEQRERTVSNSAI
jgi:hypothetical protein